MKDSFKRQGKPQKTKDLLFTNVNKKNDKSDLTFILSCFFCREDDKKIYLRKDNKNKINRENSIIKNKHIMISYNSKSRDLCLKINRTQIGP